MRGYIRNSIPNHTQDNISNRTQDNISNRTQDNISNRTQDNISNRTQDNILKYIIRKIIYVLILLLIMILITFFLDGCGEACRESTERGDIEFTICEEGQLPKELKELIEQKKADPFKLTFTTRDYTYIVVGYGAQPRGGCAVTVNALYQEQGWIHIDTNLIGMEGEPIKIDGMTYPYVVVRFARMDLQVLYE